MKKKINFFYLLFPLISLLLTSNTYAYFQLPFSNWVLGQPDVYQVTPGEKTNFKVANPGGVIVDRSHHPNRVFIYDGMNSRILGYRSLGHCQNNPHQECTTDNDCYHSQCHLEVGGEDGRKKADIVIGQPNFSTSACNGDGSYHSYPYRAKASRSSLCSLPQDQISPLEGGSFANMAVDSQGNLYVPDFLNNRVLKYNNPFETDTIADEVWGQTNFEDNDCNHPHSILATSSTLCFFDGIISPSGPFTAGVTLDNKGNLWVADPANNRVLRFPKRGENISKTADLVLGQPNFNSRRHGSALNQLYTPTAVQVDDQGNVYVSDTDNKRILVYRPPLSNGMAATIFWQNLQKPTSLALVGNQLWIGESQWKDLASQLFLINPNDNNHIIKRLINTTDTRGSLGITDKGDLILTASGSQQDAFFFRAPFPSIWDVSRQPPTAYFFSPPSGHNYLSSRGFYSPRGIAITSSQFIVSDGKRIMFWNLPPGETALNYLHTYQPADGVVGVHNFNEVILNNNHYLRIAADKNNLWALRDNLLVRFSLPLHNGQMPTQTIEMDKLKILGKKGTVGVTMAPTAIVTDPRGNFLWIALPYNYRVIRVRVPQDYQSDKYLIDTIIGGPGIPPWDKRWNPPCPERRYLCSPGSVSLDKYYNVYISDEYLETRGNGRLIRFDDQLFPLDNKELLNYDLTQAAKIYPHFYAWQPAFDSQNHMISGFVGYVSSKQQPRVYLDPLKDSPSLQEDGKVKDYFSQAYTIAFDKADNFYIADLNRGRILGYPSLLSLIPLPNKVGDTNNNQQTYDRGDVICAISAYLQHPGEPIDVSHSANGKRYDVDNNNFFNRQDVIKFIIHYLLHPLNAAVGRCLPI